jgi:hypothetical protein
LRRRICSPYWLPPASIAPSLSSSCGTEAGSWPVQRVALELDGYRYHADARTFVSDRERGNRIVSMGWTLLRTTPTAVRERPQEVVNDVRAALRRAA